MKWLLLSLLTLATQTGMASTRLVSQLESLTCKIANVYGGRVTLTTVDKTEKGLLVDTQLGFASKQFEAVLQTHKSAHLSIIELNDNQDKLAYVIYLPIDQALLSKTQAVEGEIRKPHAYIPNYYALVGNISCHVVLEK